jgi:hypothetical protein
MTAQTNGEPVQYANLGAPGCFNCGGDHRLQFCNALWCVWCNKSWPSTNSEGRHTCSTCPIPGWEPPRRTVERGFGNRSTRGGTSNSTQPRRGDRNVSDYSNSRNGDDYSNSRNGGDYSNSRNGGGDYRNGGNGSGDYGDGGNGGGDYGNGNGGDGEHENARNARVRFANDGHDSSFRGRSTGPGGDRLPTISGRSNQGPPNQQQRPSTPRCQYQEEQYNNFASGYRTDGTDY